MMTEITGDLLTEWSKLGHRNAMGDTLQMIARRNHKAVVVNPDVATTARLTGFEKEFPDRIFNVGISEQNMIGFTAGLAREGLIPFAVSIAAFAPMRCAEQMRMLIGYMNLNAKIISIEAGCRFGPLGNTHYSMDDLAVSRVIPNFTVISPSDPHMIYKALCAASEYQGPVYIRLTGAPGFPVMYPDDFHFTIGKAIEYRKGSDVAVISTGSMLSVAVDAAALLEREGISTRVIDMHTIKPLDTKMLNDVFENNSLIATIEEHSVVGGLGSAVAEYKSGTKNAPVQLMFGLGDSFLDTGSYSFQLCKNGLTAKNIAERLSDRFRSI